MTCKFIAEIGWNHQGDMDLARKMIYAAKEAGADYAKFQTWKVSRLKPGPWDTDGRREIYEKAELSEQDHRDLKEFCDDVGITFLTSIFSEDDVSFLSELCDVIKIPSTECTNIKLVEQCLFNFDTIIMSTGASDQEEYIRWAKYNKVWMMHCVSSYPCEYKNVNFNKMEFLKSLTPRIGYSGHLPEIWDAIAAISKGAKIIEKHFTIDHDLPGRDNKFALLPEEFKKIKEYIFLYDEMNIDKGLDIQECERDYRKYQMGRWNAK